MKRKCKRKDTNKPLQSCENIRQMYPIKTWARVLPTFKFSTSSYRTVHAATTRRPQWRHTVELAFELVQVPSKEATTRSVEQRVRSEAARGRHRAELGPRSVACCPINLVVHLREGARTVQPTACAVVEAVVEHGAVLLSAHKRVGVHHLEPATRRRCQRAAGGASVEQLSDLHWSVSVCFTAWQPLVQIAFHPDKCF